MGRYPRPRPSRLPKKLLGIRKALGLSQSEMLLHLGWEAIMHYSRISEFELGTAEPPLPVLLQYARVAGVHMEDIVDDELDLPKHLPGNVRYQGIKHNAASRKARR